MGYFLYAFLIKYVKQEIYKTSLEVVPDTD